MKQWLDFIPLILFYASYKALGIYTAAAILITSTILVYGSIWLKERHLESNQKLILVITILLGSATLILHDETYLKWKAPVVYWVSAIAFLVSMYIGEQPLAQRMFDKVFDMPATAWRKLNLAWVGFFVFAGAANAYVVIYFSKYWVDFKLFGSMAMTFIFLVGQIALLSRYIRQDIKE